MENQELIAQLVKQARIAQAAVAGYTQEQIDRVCTAVAWEVYNDENIARLAELAVSETGMGSIADKIQKHKNKVLGVIDDVLKVKSVGLIEEDAARGIKKYAKPVGVVGALTPVTNPTATPSSNAVSILKGRNAVIFAPHPHAKNSTKLAVDFMRQGLKKAGAPEDLIQVVEEPSIELTGELMRQVDLVVATGGGPMVKAAYSSGKPAYGVGPGNSCQIVAEDADILDAAKKLRTSKTFDNATSCSSENSIVVQQGVYDAMVKALVAEGGFLVTGETRKKLKDTMWKLNKKGSLVINGEIVARSAKAIAELAGFDIPETTVMLLVEGEMPLEDDLFAEEKLSPVLTIWRYGAFSEGVEILKRLTDNSGRGHSCGIHTFNRAYIDYLGEHMQTSRVIVRQPQAAANGGAFFNGMPSTVTLGCGTWGNNITSENITYKHFINVTWVSEPIAPHRPTDEAIFGAYLKSLG
ncbi:MAG: aldehyde dehydrogenase family protein [Clostridiales bacterium]|nr:aldehyde dehydrogenase family protein [Clostridiales bacterium]